MSRAGEALVRLSAAILGAQSLEPAVAVRTAALLLRQGMEFELDQALARSLPGAENGSFRAKVLCLEHLDRRIGVGVGSTWQALTDACHHHHYELGPSPETIQALAGECSRWLEELSSIDARTVPT